MLDLSMTRQGSALEILKGKLKVTKNQSDRHACLNNFHQSMPIKNRDWEFNKREGIGDKEQFHI